MYNFDPHNVLLAIATNIPVIHMTAFVHVCMCVKAPACLQVAPVDSRGERLLAALQASPRRRRVCGPSCVFDASISGPERLSVNSSLQDTAPKVCGGHSSNTQGKTPQENSANVLIDITILTLPTECFG